MKIKTQSTLFPFFLSLAAAGMGCAQEGAAQVATDDVKSVAQAVTAGEKLVPIDFASAQGRRPSVAERSQRIGKVLLGDAPAQVADTSREPEAEARGVNAVAAVSRPTVQVSHVAGSEDLLLVNRVASEDHGEGRDIGEAEARRVFEQTIEQLTREAADDFSGVDLKQAKTQRLRQASAEIGKPETRRESVKAYVFTAPRTLNGLQVLDADVMVSVHRSGKVAAIRTRGPVNGAAPADAQLAQAKPRVVSSDAIIKRVQSEHPGADVQSLGLVYPVGTAADGSAGMAVEPHEVVVVYEPLQGATGYGRGRRIAYSVTDANAPSVPLDTQLQNDKGDSR